MLNFSKKANQEKGDTLIEVLFAVTVFSFIVVSALTIMNQGVAASQRSLEVTLVRQQMDAQAETLRFLHESYVDAYQPGITFNTSDATTSPAEEYYKVIRHAQTSARTSASQFGGVGACRVPADSGKDFVLNPLSATLVTTATKSDIFAAADTYSQLKYTSSSVLDRSQGLWVEAVRSGNSGTAAGFIDFHIRACWDAPGLNLPFNLGTIVRLYEPRG